MFYLKCYVTVETLQLLPQRRPIKCECDIGVATGHLLYGIMPPTANVNSICSRTVWTKIGLCRIHVAWIINFTVGNIWTVHLQHTMWTGRCVLFYSMFFPDFIKFWNLVHAFFCVQNRPLSEICLFRDVMLLIKFQFISCYWIGNNVYFNHCDE